MGNALREKGVVRVGEESPPGTTNDTNDTNEMHAGNDNGGFSGFVQRKIAGTLFRHNVAHPFA